MFPIVNDLRGWTTTIATDRKKKERRESRLLEAHEVCRKMGWKNPQRIDEAQAFGFPTCARFRTEVKNGGAIRHPLYDEAKVNEWIDNVRALLAGLA